MTRILALVDSSRYADSVCDHAGWAAERLGDPVSLLHVMARPDGADLPLDLTGNMTLDGRDTLLKALTEHDAKLAREAQHKGRDLLDGAAVRVKQAGAAEVTALMRIGEFVRVFEDNLDDVDLVVLGKRGETAERSMERLGSNLERAVRSSPAPLLIAARAFRPVHRVAVGFDGRLSAAKAVEYVAESPLFKDCAIELLTVGHLDVAGQTAREGALRFLSERGFAPSVASLEGDPAKAMAEHVEQAGTDLLAIGAYGHSRLRSMVIGSTTSEILRACKLPTMLFR
jgi:nucleotide-binding universal stress UspA family protein